MSEEFDDILTAVSQMRSVVDHVPVHVREDIQKGRYRPKQPSEGMKALLEDPMSLQYSMGYKDRKYSLTYDVIKQVVQSLSILSAIIQTRTNQIASFSVPYRISKSVGYVIKHKDPGKLTTKGEREMIKDLEKFIYNCGAAEPNPHNMGFRRDDFETFLKKIVRDSLMYDQTCFEIVPDRKGLPYEFMAVDSSTIRLAANTSAFGPNDTYHDRPPIVNNHTWYSNIPSDPYRMLKLNGPNEDRPAYVQVVDGQIETVFTFDELAFGVRNPRSDIYIQGYGYGEIEQLISIITAHLNAEEYNRRFFMQGSAPKGILNIKGDAMTPDQLEGFKRMWRANAYGVENAWKTPILQSEQGVDWINLNATNREMEYGQWMEYLIKITCGVFLIDPAELNFDLAGGQTNTPLFESSSEWKLKASRDRGLKPLLRFIAKLINDHVISKIDDHFVFDFVGLDELTEQEKHELRTEKLAAYMTLNEIRREEDLPDVEDGDMVLNPTYIQARQVKQQMDMQEQQMSQAAEAPQQQQEAGGGGADTSQAAAQDKDVPQYGDTFTKSLLENHPEQVVEIAIDDDWIDVFRK